MQQTGAAMRIDLAFIAGDVVAIIDQDQQLVVERNLMSLLYSHRVNPWWPCRVPVLGQRSTRTETRNPAVRKKEAADLD